MKIKLFLLVFVMCFFNTKAQNNTITCTGDILQITIPAAALASTFVWNDDNTKPTWQFIKVYGTSLLLQQTLKHIVQKPRPDGSNNLSFPSGHTTSAFAGAAFIQRRYGWQYGIPSYLLASFVGYSRIQAKKHDGWDVLAGATIGVGSAYLFTKPYEKNKIDVSFNNSQKVYLISFNHTF